MGATFADMERRHWWVYDRPFVHDWMFGLGLAVGVLFGVQVLLDEGQHTGFGLVVQLVTAWFGGLFWTGVLVGSGREYMRARRARPSGGAGGSLPSVP